MNKLFIFFSLSLCFFLYISIHLYLSFFLSGKAIIFWKCINTTQQKTGATIGNSKKRKKKSHHKTEIRDRHIAQLTFKSCWWEASAGCMTGEVIRSVISKTLITLLSYFFKHIKCVIKLSLLSALLILRIISKHPRYVANNDKYRNETSNN